MRRTATNYILLILVTILSFLSIRSFEFHPTGTYDKSLDNLRFFTPGILFSFYLVILQRSNFTIRKLVVFFFVLSIIYIIVFEACLASWGAGVPFAGGIGAYLIKKTFYRGELFESTDKKYLITGFASGLVGVFLFYLGQDRWPAGVGFGLILMLWQFSIGLVWIDQTEKVDRGLRKN